MDLQGMVPPDPETEVSRECFAVVRKGRGQRKRFAAACVQECKTAEAALARVAGKPQLAAARLVGPSKSSEGQYIYYLVEWLHTAG